MNSLLEGQVSSFLLGIGVEQGIYAGYVQPEQGRLFSGSGCLDDNFKMVDEKGVLTVKQSITAGLILAAFVGGSAVAQDWYHDRENRYQGQQWRSQVFLQVRSDLDHIWSANRASDKERTRLKRTKQELTELQAKLDGGRFDNGTLNDVIDSIAKSANDDRLAPRDREVLSDDLARLKDYQNNHNHWKR